MRLPKKLRIGPHIIKVSYKKDLKWKKEGKAADEKLLGYADCTGNAIYLERGMPKTKKMEVFLHESLHIIDDLYALSLGEKRVNTLACVLIDFIRTNKVDFNG